MSTYESIYAVVRRIPRGRVASYGQVAEAAGLHNAARQVGYALHALKDGAVPWQRVVNRLGEITQRGDPDYQRERLEAEGVVLDARGRVPKARFVTVTKLRG